MTSPKIIIDNFSNDPSENSMQALIELSEKNGLADDDLAYLTKRLAESGQVIDTTGLGYTADIASTGSPSSLSTLLCPLYLRAMGYSVPSLGVPGRPAGGVDVLAQIPGYKITLTKSEAETVLRKCGYVHLSRKGVSALCFLFSNSVTQ